MPTEEIINDEYRMVITFDEEHFKVEFNPVIQKSFGVNHPRIFINKEIETIKEDLNDLGKWRKFKELKKSLETS